jgi:molybdopterin synthase sulfur carrier subunit
MRVHLSTHFQGYTGGKGTVEARGASVAAVFQDLERQFPGLRWRAIDEQDHVRRHVKVYVNLTSIEDLSTPVTAADEVHVLGALSGG